MSRVYTELVDLCIDNKIYNSNTGWVNAEYYKYNRRSSDKIKAVALRYYDIVLGQRTTEGVENLSLSSMKLNQIYKYSFTVVDGNEVVGGLSFMCREKEFNEVMKFYTQPYLMKNSNYKFNKVYKEDIISSIRREYEI